MTLVLSAILQQNVTLVYDRLDLRSINTADLKRLSESAPAIMDTPDMIVAIYPDQQVIIQLGDNRVRITAQKQQTQAGQLPVWRYAIGAHRLATSSELVAFGYNYDVVLTADENLNVMNLVIGEFVHRKDMLEESFQASIVSAVPRFKFVRDNKLYDLFLEPLDERRLKAHLNVHFQDRPLPAETDLETSFLAEYAYFELILMRLLQEEMAGD